MTTPEINILLDEVAFNASTTEIKFPAIVEGRALNFVSLLDAIACDVYTHGDITAAEYRQAAENIAAIQKMTIETLKKILIITSTNNLT